RVFLGTEQPALAAAARWLIDQYAPGDRSTDDVGAGLDLAQVLIVTPGGRASRRLFQTLVAACETRRLGPLTPPRTTTLGDLPEQLYEPTAQADAWAARLALAHALHEAPAEVVAAAFGTPPDNDDLAGWFRITDELSALINELAGEQVTAAGVAEQTGDERWRAIAALLDRYQQALDAQGLADRATQRRRALDEGRVSVSRDVVLLGVVEMPAITAALLDAVGDRVTALIHADPADAEAFDALGRLAVEAWAERRLELTEDCLRMADRPGDQALAVLEAIEAAAEEQPIGADQITVGFGEAELAPIIVRSLEMAGIEARQPPGHGLAESRPALLLRAAATFLRTRRFDDLAELVRHPDLDLAPDGVAHWQTLLDEYLTEHVQARVTARWFGRHAASLKAVYDNLMSKLPDQPDRPRPLPAWAEPLLGMLQSVYGHHELSRGKPEQASLLAALSMLADAIEALGEVDAARPFVPKVTAAEAIELLLGQIADQVVPGEPDRAAVEVLGYLELPLDDAPVTIITGFNEGAIPASRTADALLPDSLRTRLGLPDNRARYARDLYVLHTITREKPGAVLIAGQRSAEGDPLLPSRLMLACDEATMVDRLHRFYDETPRPVAPPLIAPGRDDDFGLLLPPVRPVEPPLSKLRVTAFRDYLACPYRFYLRHVLGLEGLDDDAVEMSGSVFGTLAHRVFRAFGQSDLAPATDAPSIAAFLRDRLTQEADQVFGQEPTAAVRLQLQQLEERLERFALAQAAEAAAGWRILPEQLEQKHEATMGVDDQPFTITGQIDRIDEHPELGYRIIDYKSADTAKAPDDVHLAGPRQDKRWIDLQLPLYRVLAGSSGIRGAVWLGYALLPRKLTEVGYAWAAWDADQLTEAEEVARGVIRAVRAGRFWPPGDAPDYDDAYAAICADRAPDRSVLIARSSGASGVSDA
ncbi:MAG: hypothetical protein GVY24_06370, partial [Planctomycetes bacterium]|nr:hypothetical protein [Planctomycetota bacterium]